MTSTEEALRAEMENAGEDAMLVGMRDRKLPVYIWTHRHDLQTIRNNIARLQRALTEARAWLDKMDTAPATRLVMANHRLQLAQNDLQPLKPKRESESRTSRSLRVVG